MKANGVVGSGSLSIVTPPSPFFAARHRLMRDGCRKFFQECGPTA